MPPTGTDRIHRATAGFRRATDAGDPVEAAEYALELLNCHTVKTFSPDAVVTVDRPDHTGRPTVHVTDPHGRYGPDNHRVATLTGHLGSDVVAALPPGSYSVG